MGPKIEPPGTDRQCPLRASAEPGDPLACSMTSSLDNEYQDSTAPGSLVGALRMWRILLASSQHEEPRHLTFAYACPSRTMARDLADFLRDAEASAVDPVRPGRGALALDEWQVEGITRREVQSLPALEGLLTRLRLAGAGHRSRLVSLVI
jgi:hypothetical protein